MIDDNHKWSKMVVKIYVYFMQIDKLEFIEKLQSWMK